VAGSRLSNPFDCGGEDVKGWLLRLDDWAGFARDKEGVWEANLRRWWLGLVGGMVWITVVTVLAIRGTGLGLLGLGPMFLFLAFASGYYYAHRLDSLGRVSRFRGLQPPDPSGERNTAASDDEGQRARA
jgi:hypothetical protein